MENDYSLLRPFDLDAAKMGDRVCYRNNADTFIEYIAGPDDRDIIAYRNSNGYIYTAPKHSFAMAPICWIEGKPVYKGDVLYRKDIGHKKVTAESIFKDGGYYLKFTDGGNARLSDGGDSLTWTPPMIKHCGWINIYRELNSGEAIRRTVGDIYDTQDDADSGAGSERVDCIPIEWKEPAK